MPETPKLDSSTSSHELAVAPYAKIHVPVPMGVRSVAITGDQVAEGQTVSIDDNEATLEGPEGCIYSLKVVHLYEENMHQQQRAQFCCNSSCSAIAL